MEAVHTLSVSKGCRSIIVVIESTAAGIGRDGGMNR